MIVFAFFLFGLIIGSFLNVVIVRLRTLESILGRSFCRHCRKKIRWYDNIPLLSFVVLRGKCRDCGERVSWRYPAVEALVAVLFAIAGYVFFDPSDVLSWVRTMEVLGIIAFATVIGTYDARHKEIPMTILWMGIVWAGVFALWKDAAVDVTHLSDAFNLSLHSGVLAGFSGFLFFFLLSAVSRERWMGLGDAYVVFWMGLVVGWPNIYSAVLLAFVFGALWGVLMIVFGKSSLKSQLPFAPFLLAGMVLMLFFGNGISLWGNVW